MTVYNQMISGSEDVENRSVYERLLNDETSSDIYPSKFVSPISKRGWRSYIWDSLDKSAQERKFLFKLDAAVMTIASLGYFIKNLDQVNISNAFVSGMKEDLGLYKNQLNYMQTCWTIGYVIGQIPSNFILTRVRPSIWIPCMEVTWAMLTLGLATCNNAESIYILRFLIGLAESTYYPGMQYIIGSWYREDELAKRSCIFHASGSIGAMFSGYLMASVHHLRGAAGLKGWQWLFVVDGIISLPIAVGGFLLLPDVPEITKVWYLTPSERDFSRKRMQSEGRAQRAPYTRAKFRKIFTSWHIYLLSILYISFNNASSGIGQPTFAMYLKASTNPKYTIAQINLYPTATAGLSVITTLIYAWTSDSTFRGARWPPMLIGGLVCIVCYSSLAVWDIATWWHWTCYILAGMGVGISGLCMAWAHEICSDDNEERALVVATMNESAYFVQAWLPLLVWQQVDAPRYHKGFVTSTCFNVVMIVTALVIRQLWRKEKLGKARKAAGFEIPAT